ncbi:cupin domain-containing protein [Lacihabitans sp. CS3-21]|uniref:cupin domain-containing protein n=1 Tax=Lacihabitans sp. CS3-21 TaxID=2487332 RepID=UPI0020CBDC0B|nr:cupin domain-containing protein [Lacihabitans sp. CS3-21]MCP9746791.1 cupin domain-containing protein [Lacihabitans sp. CS3-21]
MSQPIRRIVTGHTKEGKAIFTIDEEIETVVIPTGDAAMATLWTSASVPADCNDQINGRIRDAGTTLKGGSVIRVVDMLPGASSPMHRSASIDYGIVMSGEIELELDDKIFKTVGIGGVIIQNGTIHKWRNPSPSKICRIIFVLTEAKPFEVNGVPLTDEMIHD